MTKIEYVEILDKRPVRESNPAEIAEKLEMIINNIKNDSHWAREFICSNFIGTKSVYGSEDNTICNEPDNTIYQFMLFFDERYN